MSYFANTRISDSTGNNINPATDESIILLRRVVKLLESNAVVDLANRQRITIDSIGPATGITTTIPVSGTVTATVSSCTIAAGGVFPVDQRWEIVDRATTAYNLGIRSKLTFS